MQLRLFRVIFVAFGLAAALLLPVAGRAADESAAVMKVISSFVTASNTGDIKIMEAAFAGDATIVDDVPPHYWSGAHAVARWFAALVKTSKAMHKTDELMSVSPTKFGSIDGAHAYAPVAGVYTYKQNGKPLKETGVLVYSLQKIDGAWKITAMAWSQIP